MRAKITKRLVDATAPRLRDVFVWDTEEKGFGLKVTPAGSKSYVFQYRMGGRRHPTRRYAIGPHGAFTPDRARNKSQELRALVSGGDDPGYLKIEQRKQARALARETFGIFAEEYIKRECPQLKRGDAIVSIIRRELLPSWSDRPVTELRKRDAIALTDALLDADKPAAAHKLHQVIKRIGNWLVDRDELEISPFASWKPPARIEYRAKALTDDEITTLWQVWTDIDYPFGTAAKLLLLLGQRRDEVGHMLWPEVDLDRAEWMLPSERTKSSRAHLVPLPDMAASLLQDVPRFENDYVFSTTSGRRPIGGFSKTKKRVDEASGVEGWRWHDLRRTCRTGMAALGVPDVVAERVLNHQPQGLVKIYNLHEYTSEKREALDRWAQRVAEIVTPPPANVVNMRKRALS